MKLPRPAKIQENGSAVAGILGQIAVFVMMVAICADVVARYFFDSPITGIKESTEFFLVVAVFLGLAHTQYKGGNVRVSVIRMRFPTRWQDPLELLSLVLMFFFFVMLGWQSGVAFWRSLLIRETFLTTDLFPAYVTKGLLPMGCLMMCIELLFEIGQVSRRLFRRSGTP